MYNIKTNKHQNLMTLTFSGHFTYKITNDIIHEIAYNADRLEPDFDVIIDIRHFKPASINVLQQIKTVKKTLRDRGSRYGVFAIGSSTYALTMFAKFANFQDKDLFFVPTMRDAERKMNELTTKINS